MVYLLMPIEATETDPKSLTSHITTLNTVKLTPEEMPTYSEIFLGEVRAPGLPANNSCCEYVEHSQCWLAGICVV